MMGQNGSVKIIEARPQAIGARLFSLWRYKSFYGFLFKEILTKKYRDTFFGVWWLVIQPLVPAIIFILLFSAHPMTKASAVPYPVFFLSSYITWNLFVSTLGFMPRTLLWMQGIMSRTYFPRLLVPLAGFGPPLVQFAVMSIVLLFVVSFYWITKGHCPLHLGWSMLLVIPCFIMALMFGLAIGMFISVVALFFRDVVFSVTYFSQLFMFLTPVIYPVSFVPKNYHWLLYTLNPMAKLVEVSRWAFTGQGQFDPFYFTLSVGTIILVFCLSVAFFLRAEIYLADQM